MANSKQHAKAGAFIGGVVAAAYFTLNYYQKKQEAPELKFNWGKLLLFVFAGVGIGLVTGILPDRIEPATNPNHRGFFHSYFLSLLMFIGLLKTLDNNQLNPAIKVLTFSAIAGYCSHLALDGATPKSLPMIA